MCLNCYALCFPMYMEALQWTRALLLGPKDVLQFVSFELLLNRSRPNPFRAEEVEKIFS